MESEIFTDDQDKEVTSQLPGIWSVFNSEVPWKLPVVHPCGEGEAEEIHDDIVKNALNQSFLNKFYPGYSISFPWPWSVFLNFVLLEKCVLSSVNEIVPHIQ